MRRVITLLLKLTYRIEYRVDRGGGVRTWGVRFTFQLGFTTSWWLVIDIYSLKSDRHKHIGSNRPKNIKRGVIRLPMVGNGSIMLYK